MGKNIVKATQWFKKCYKDSAILKTTIKRGFSDLKRGGRYTDDAERGGRPNEAVTSETKKK